jgi:hypothetical protein
MDVLAFVRDPGVLLRRRALLARLDCVDDGKKSLSWLLLMEASILLPFPKPIRLVQIDPFVSDPHLLF